MAVDHYARSGRRWASGAMRVYGPIAELLVDMCPHPLAGRRVLDAGAGTGAAGAVLARRGARALAVDLSPAMLAASTATVGMRAAADVRALPLREGAVDACVAAFVLNHLTDPAAGMAELARATRPGGAILATAFGSEYRSRVRDRIDEVALEEGWRVPAWYAEVKATAVPLLGSAAAMAAAARAAGLGDVDVDERAVDVGVTAPEDLIAYRFGQAHFAAWLDEIGPERGRRLRARAAGAIRPIMEPYRPVVVFLRALAD
jgi:SAM-dependent methyltransferase